MEIMPSGTIDPSPYIYNLSLFTLAGFTSIAFFVNYFMKPIDKKHFEIEKIVEFSEEKSS